MQYNQETSEFVLSSGRCIYAYSGAIGIDPDLFVSYGYDDGLFGAESDWSDGNITADDKRELADYMIDLWARFKEAVE